MPKTEAEQQLEQLEKLENTDSVIQSVLTGLRAREGYSDERLKEIERALREKLGMPEIAKN